MSSLEPDPTCGDDSPERFTSTEEIIEYAIAREEEAYLFYYDLGNGARSSQLKKLFHSFAREEKMHREKLIKLRDGRQVHSTGKSFPDMRIADYLAPMTPGQATDYQRVLMLAMQRERAAFRLYSDLANMVADPDIKELLIGLAREEARHKLAIELEYDEQVLTDN